MSEKQKQLQIIHESFVNGLHRQMVRQIDDYGLYDFWADYKEYLYSVYTGTQSVFEYFADTTISYFRIKNR